MEKKRMDKRNEKILSVFLSEKLVSPTDAINAVPHGYRQANLEDVVLKYRNDEKFREELHEKGPAWIAQKGLLTRGAYRINSNGELTRMEDLDGFNSEEKSYHFSGTGYVAVDLDDAARGLDIDARIDTGLFETARVAYVCVNNGNDKERGMQVGPLKKIMRRSTD